MQDSGTWDEAGDAFEEDVFVDDDGEGEDLDEDEEFGIFDDDDLDDDDEEDLTESRISSWEDDFF